MRISQALWDEEYNIKLLYKVNFLNLICKLLGYWEGLPKS